MLSRVADSLFWMSRYMERADGILRMLKTNYHHSQDTFSDFSWDNVLKIFTYLNNDEIQVLNNNSREILWFMVFEKENPNSVLNMVTLARENGRGVQDHITKEMWRCLNDFYHYIREDSLQNQLKREDPISVLDNLTKQAMVYFGTTEVTMPRGEGSAFINIGKYLERGLQTANILDVSFSGKDAEDATYCKYLLISLSGYQLYLKKYRTGFTSKNVIEQVVLNDDFPRSLVYCAHRLQRYFIRLRTDKKNPDFEKIDFMIGKLLSNIKFSTIHSITDAGLHQFLTDTKTQLLQIGTSLSGSYFA